MSTTVKRVIGAVAGVTALAFLGIFAYGVVTKITEDDADESEDDYDDGELQ